ncbi:MAG: hypothetical protein IJX31_03550, partial [Clostridia bacterium]|nr:hypothetical protein [Clostridia bacterium]
MTTNKLRFVETAPARSKEEIVERKKSLRGYMKERRGENENRDVKESLLIANVLRALEEKGMGT